MEHYGGLDVSLKAVSICVTDGSGVSVWRGDVVNDVTAVRTALSRHAPQLRRVVLESGSCGIHLYRGLQAAGVPVVCVCARHAKGVLQCRINKTDANDAEGLAQLARTGWYREVYVKSTQAQTIRAHLLARKQVAKARRDVENQLRATLRVFGLKVGAVGRAGFEVRVRELAGQVGAVEAPIDQLLVVRQSLLTAQDKLDKEARAMAQRDARCRLLQTMPGIGPLNALAFVSTVDGPARFAKSAAMGAYLGLTPRGHQSGAVAWTGRISKTGDALTRALLYEAANSLMVRVKSWPPLKVWACKLAKRVGAKKARVALARKLAVIMHRMLADNEPYRWKAAA